MKHRMRTIMLLLLTMLLLCPIQVLAAGGENAVKTDLEDGEYSIQVELEGGSGKASVSSPTLMLVKEGKMYARLQWSSSNYDYMIVDGEKYLNESEEGRNSVFTVPVTALDDKMEVIADTLAMGAPHEIDYTLTFYEASIGSKGQLPQEAAKRVVAVALVIIIGGGISEAFHFCPNIVITQRPESAKESRKEHAQAILNAFAENEKNRPKRGNDE